MSPDPFSLVIALLVAGITYGQEEGPERIVVNRSYLTVMWLVGKTGFPGTWIQPPINGCSAPLDFSDHSAALKVVKTAFSKYPDEFVERELDTIYLLKDLQFYNRPVCGTSFGRALFVHMIRAKSGFDEASIEKTVHHELSSILLFAHYRNFPAVSWMQINPPGFHYIDDIQKAVGANELGLDFQKQYWSKGFLCQFSTTSMRNDFTMLAENLFKPDPDFWTISDANPALHKKTDLAIKFYQSLSPIFSEEYFRALAKYPGRRCPELSTIPDQANDHYQVPACETR